MRLKPRKRGQERPSTVCSASRCNAEPAIIVSTGKLDAGDVHLCDRHWQQHCDETEAEAEAERAEAERVLAKVLNPKLPPGLEPGRYNVRYTEALELEVIP